MSSGAPKSLPESPSQTLSDGACPAIPEVSSSPPPLARTPLLQAPAALPQQAATAVSPASGNVRHAGEAAPDDARPPIRDEHKEPIKTSWWRVPASKLIPGMGAVPPQGVVC